MFALKITGADSITRELDDAIAALEKDAADFRRNVTTSLALSLAENIPVWSGQTLASMTVSNSGVVRPAGARPSASEMKRFGATNKMPLGAEPMRGSAMATAMATLGSVNYNMDQRVVLTINSRAWELVERGAAPGGPGQAARNRGLVSEIAIAKTKAQFPNLK